MAPAEHQKISQEPDQDAIVTPQASAEFLSVEEKVEYRDQDGNILGEAQVAALEGKASFQTRYDTRTQVLDPADKEAKDLPSAVAPAPPHPDVDREPETPIANNIAEDKRRDYPATASADKDEIKEKSVAKADGKKPRPASEGREATK